MFFCFCSELKLWSNSFAEKNCHDEISTWIIWKTEQNLEIWPFLNSRLEMWVWENGRKIDPATGVSQFIDHWINSGNFFDKLFSSMNNTILLLSTPQDVFWWIPWARFFFCCPLTLKYSFLVCLFVFVFGLVSMCLFSVHQKCRLGFKFMFSWFVSLFQYFGHSWKKSCIFYRLNTDFFCIKETFQHMDSKVWTIPKCWLKYLNTAQCEMRPLDVGRRRVVVQSE